MKTRSGAELKREASEHTTDGESKFEMATNSNMHSNLDVRRPDHLKFEGNVSEQWRIFKQNFDIYAIAIDFEERKETQKVGIFLNACGPETIEIFNTFDLSTELKKNYNAVLAVVENYCTPKKNEVYEAFKFNSRKQEEGEPFEAYLLDLRKLVRNCGYTDTDRMIRDNIVIGINSQKLQKKLLETENLTLQRTIEIARAVELVEKYADEMQQQQHKNSEVSSISTYKQISQNSGKRNSLENARSLNIENTHIKHKMRPNSNCRFCKGVHEFRKCPAFGKKCNNCGRLNHFSVACYGSQVHEIRRNDEQRENDDIVLHNVEDLKAGRKRWYEKIRINDCIINFKLDTGADVNILPYKYFKKCMKNTVLDKSGLPPRSYSGADLDYKGIIQSVVMCRNEIKILQFTVVDTPYEPLLGLDACVRLNLIKRIDVIREASKDEFVRNYSDVFEGTGCFVSNLDIQVKKSSVPVVKPARRIPQSLVGKVKNELQNMVENEIIERADGPIERASNLVIVEKKSGKLRLCIDPQDLNADILSENHTIPSFESIAVRIANCKIFTVLDLKEGFWQIGLSAKASELCSFNTPFGCYRFKRLPYGIKIGPEVFQKYNERNFEDIPNVIVFIDDILIAAKSVEEHDRTLKLVMDRAREVNIKFNVDKIQYKVAEVKYLGKIISQDGIRCDPDRVKAIMKIQKPNTKKDLQKLLGMINYIREYIPNLSSISQPLRELLKFNVVYEWQTAHESCLQLIKTMIANAPTLQTFDDKKEITLETDASKFGIGCCLMQNGKPIAFTSRTLTDAEINYAQVEKELLAILFAVANFITTSMVERLQLKRIISL